MPPTLCQSCNTQRALILRPKNHHRLCRTCFLTTFELEIHHTIITHSLFQPGERIAIGASGGKDSTVLASVMKTLNERYNYGLDLILLSIDEGITGYRDDSLETVKRNAVQYGMELEILGYKELYGWTMDEVVKQVGKKGNCTYCGVFRRQALDRGAAKLGVQHVVTGHNADDIAETVLMNLLRGDLPRLARATSILTSSTSSPIKRSKPLKYAYEKEIVLYAHHKKLDYFSTECLYSPEAFRGSARALIKNLERIRPSAILDVVRSGEDMARLVPGEMGGAKTCGNAKAETKVDAEPTAQEDEGEVAGGCGSGAGGRSSGGEMADMERKLQEDEKVQADGLETEITSASVTSKGAAQQARQGQRHDRSSSDTVSDQSQIPHATPIDQLPGSQILQPQSAQKSQSTAQPPAQLQAEPQRTIYDKKNRKVARQQLGQCQRCGYISSQAVCKACMLLEGLNRNRPKMVVDVGVEDDADGSQMMRQMEGLSAS